MTKAKLAAIREYSDAEFQAIRDSYAKGDGQTIEEIAGTTQRSPRSIIAKLNNVHDYVKPVKTSKTGSTQRKEDLADTIGEILELGENDTSSLQKPTKLALVALVAKFESMGAIIQSLTDALDVYEDVELEDLNDNEALPAS
jgi:hypothetical protein